MHVEIKDVPSHREDLTLFLASLVTLYFELLIIRYVSSEVRVFTNLKNLPLVASFFGIGLGMLTGSPRMQFRAMFPSAAALLFLLTRFAAPLHLSFPDVSWNYGLVSPDGLVSRIVYFVRFLGIGLGYSALIIVFFRVLGGHVGQSMKRLPSLRAYGLKLSGGLAGMALFSFTRPAASRTRYLAATGVSPSRSPGFGRSAHLGGTCRGALRCRHPRA